MGIQSVINAYPSNTTFCLASGKYLIGAPILPKGGDRFIAVQSRQVVLTGSDRTSMAFNGEGVTGVTIQGLVITHFVPPSQAGYAALKASGGWKIINNEISYNANQGLYYEGDSTLVSGNYIHHNTAIGLGGYKTTNSIVEKNEVAFNGSGSSGNGGSKWVGSSNLTIRNNYFHDNNYAGIWLDTDNVGATVTNNTSSNNAGTGIHDEVNCSSLYQYNTVRNNGLADFNIVASNGTRVLDNVVGGTIALWHQDRSAASCPGGLANVVVHGNQIDLPDGTTMSDLTGVFVCCGATGNGLTRVKEWDYNRYAATNTTAIHFQYGGIYNVSFSGWSSGTGFDKNGTIALR
jgi:parallel beta helix pectate lyase-like protein